MNHKGKTFIVLTPGFAASEADSTCLPMQQNFVKAISELYPSLTIFILSFQYPFQKRVYQWHNATVVSFGGKNKGGISRLLLRRKVLTALNRICSTEEVIGLLSFWVGECAVVGKRIGKKYGIPYYSWILGQDARAFNKYPQQLSVKGNELIALSDFLQEEFEKNHGVRPFAVVAPGVDVQKLHKPERDIDLLGAGSLIPLKQFEIFIEAVIQIRKQLPNIKVILAGEGPEKNNLQNLIITNGLQNTVYLTGAIPHQEVLNLMQRTKVLLHPSSYEGFPGVCLEALGSGAHVISFCRAMNEHIQQWHIVNNKEKMVETAIAILNSESAVFNRVIFQSMTSTARQMMEYFQ